MRLFKLSIALMDASLSLALDPGDDGPRGMPGLRGAKGEQGKMGPRGEEGTAGIDGLPGKLTTWFFTVQARAALAAVASHLFLSPS